MKIGVESSTFHRDFIGGYFENGDCPNCRNEMFLLGRVEGVYVYICENDYHLNIRDIAHKQVVDTPKFEASPMESIDIDWGEEAEDSMLQYQFEQTLTITKKQPTLSLQDIPETDYWKFYIKYMSVPSEPKKQKAVKVEVEANDWNEGYEEDSMKQFLKFNEAISALPDQLIRYGPNEKPLFYTQKVYPNCCGTCMSFRFQFMPCVLDYLVYDSLEASQYANALDFGTVLIFKCLSCERFKGICQRDC